MSGEQALPNCPKCEATEIKDWLDSEHWCRRCAWTWGGQREGRYSGEGMSRGKDGLLHDEEFHEELLDNPEADLACCIQSFQWVVRELGTDPEQARKMYGLDEETAHRALAELEEGK